jgi:hypothetical protein
MRSLRQPGSGRRDGQVKGQRHGRDKRFGVTSGRFRTLSLSAGTHRGISYASGFPSRLVQPGHGTGEQAWKASRPPRTAGQSAWVSNFPGWVLYPETPP